MTNVFGLFFVVFSSKTNLTEQYVKLHEALWRLLSKLWKFFSNTLEVVENTFFKKKAILPMKKTLACLPLAKSNITNVREQIIRVQKVFWYLLCKVYFYFYRTYEVVRNKHFKKRRSLRWQRVWPIFPYIIEYEKPQGANDKRVEVFLKLMWELSVYCYRT